jgi:outer membrane lipoprotein-sorting protein
MTLEELMGALRKVQSVDASYVESVEMSLLTQTLTTRGRLHYEAPDRIEMIDSRGDSVRIKGDRLLIADASGSRELAIADFVALDQLVVSLRGIFAGDLAALHERYDLAFRPAEEGSDGRWTLSLRPKGPSLFRVIDRIEIAGRAETIERIDLVEPNGDRRVLSMDVTRRVPARLP